MKQKGNNSNNLQIKNVGDGSTLTINQGADGPAATELCINQKTIRTFEHSELATDGAIGLLKLVCPLILASAASAADFLSIVNFFDVSFGAVIFCAAILGTALALPHYESIFILSQCPKALGQEKYVGNNEILRKEAEHVVNYHRTAKCTFSGCEGSICVVKAPERGQSSLNQPFVGMCSKGLKDHTYRIDYLWNASCELFDWTPTDAKTK